MVFLNIQALGPMLGLQTQARSHTDRYVRSLQCFTAISSRT